MLTYLFNLNVNDERMYFCYCKWLRIDSKIMANIVVKNRTNHLAVLLKKRS